MLLNEYQDLALKTGNMELSYNDRLASLTLGLSGESGEIADVVKKFLSQGHNLDKDKIKVELGDLMWYVAVLSDFLGFELADVADQNIEKLRKRYPQGFDVARSLNRAEGDV